MGFLANSYQENIIEIMHGFTFNDTNIKKDNKHKNMFIVYFYVCVIEGKTMHYFNDYY